MVPINGKKQTMKRPPYFVTCQLEASLGKKKRKKSLARVYAMNMNPILCGNADGTHEVTQKRQPQPQLRPEKKCAREIKF